MSTTTTHAWTSLCAATRVGRPEADRLVARYGGRVERIYGSTFVVKSLRGYYLRLIERQRHGG